MIVATLVYDPLARARLVDALRDQAHVRVCDRALEVSELVRSGIASMVVIDFRDRLGESTLPLVRELRDEFPSVPVVLYCSLRPENARSVLEFARAGVNDLILRDVDDLRRTLRQALMRAEEHCTAGYVIEQLWTGAPHPVVNLLRACLERGRRALTVRELARELGVSRKTLADWTRAASFPPPEAIISWCRLMVCARLLEDPGRSVTQVAMLADFPSSTSLRNMLRRYTGLRPLEIRENGGLRCVIHAFKRAVEKVGISSTNKAT
ncbi:MAG: helix-turn-helix domain-containing protein [Gemmatimonadaceae bacterium]